MTYKQISFMLEEIDDIFDKTLSIPNVICALMQNEAADVIKQAFNMFYYLPSKELAKSFIKNKRAISEDEDSDIYLKDTSRYLYGNLKEICDLWESYVYIPMHTIATYLEKDFPKSIVKFDARCIVGNRPARTEITCKINNIPGNMHKSLCSRLNMFFPGGVTITDIYLPSGESIDIKDIDIYEDYNYNILLSPKNYNKFGIIQSEINDYKFLQSESIIDDKEYQELYGNLIRQEYKEFAFRALEEFYNHFLTINLNPVLNTTINKYTGINEKTLTFDIRQNTKENFINLQKCLEKSLPYAKVNVEELTEIFNPDTDEINYIYRIFFMIDIPENL